MNKICKFISIGLVIVLTACSNTNTKNDEPKHANVQTQKPKETVPKKESPSTEIKSLKQGKSYTGFIGENLKIQMKLKQDNEKLTGTYFYDKFKKEINISGNIINDTYIYLEEKNGEGKNTGYFDGVVVSPDKIEGIWRSEPDNGNTNTKKPLKFALITDGKNIEDLKQTNDKSQSWNGNWTRENSTNMSSSEFEITHYTGRSFGFVLSAHEGANQGYLQGVALINGTEATYMGEYNAKFKFTLKNGAIELWCNENGSHYAGAGVYFPGIFHKGVEPKKLSFDDYEFFSTKDQENAFKEMVGDDFSKFEDTLHIVQISEDNEKLGSKVISSGIRGLFTISESIIMVTPSNKFWAAVIKDDEVHYFTNTDMKKILPKTIDNWRERFKNKRIVYRSN